MRRSFKFPLYRQEHITPASQLSLKRPTLIQDKVVASYGKKHQNKPNVGLTNQLPKDIFLQAVSKTPFRKNDERFVPG